MNEDKIPELFVQMMILLKLLLPKFDNYVLKAPNPSPETGKGISRIVK